MSNFEGGVSIFSDMAMIAGSKIATAPMLFMKADIKPTVTIMITITRSGLFPPRRSIDSPIKSATPV